MSNTSPNQPSLLVSVGDPSADRHMAKLLAKLKENQPDLHVWGLGGTSMIREGAEILFNCEDFSTIGILSLIKVLPFFIRLRQTILDEIDKRKPKAVLLVDFSGFNLILARAIKNRFKEIPIFYFISPQVWGSRPWRINSIAKTVSKIFVIFPFEADIYAKRNVPVRFVGHPLTRNLPGKGELLSRQEFCEKYNLAVDKPIIGVFPGSRKSEIRNLLPMTLDASQWLLKSRPNLQFAFSQANDDLGQSIKNKFRGRSGQANNLRLVAAADNYSLMSLCDILWAKSGTTALEGTLYGRPMLAFYRADWPSFLIFLAFKRIKRIAWPNILSRKALVPELIQLDCRADQLVKYTADLLDVPQLREEISRELFSLRDKLGEGDYATLCAEEIGQAIKQQELIASI